MNIDITLNCPNCNSSSLKIKRRVTYVYTYELNKENYKEIINNTDKLPFTFDNREKASSEEYIKCDKCGEEYDIKLEEINNKINFIIMEKAIRADFVKNPEFFG